MRVTRRVQREALLFVLVISAVFLAGWAFYLAFRLPASYRADHWRVAWIGFDIAQSAMLIATAWAIWRRRVILVLFAISSAVFFLADAWFDLTTARGGDLTQSVLAAVLIEVPAAVALLLVARRAVQVVANEWWRSFTGTDAPPPSRLTLHALADSVTSSRPDR
jgi:hypothetical protein